MHFRVKLCVSMLAIALLLGLAGVPAGAQDKQHVVSLSDLNKYAARSRSDSSHSWERFLTRMDRIGLGLLLLPFLGPSARTGPQERAGIWLDVPYVKQSEDGCGSASISMLLQYWNAHGAGIDPQRAD